MKPIYKRIILKITGEAFHRNERSINQFARRDLIDEIEEAYRLGVEIGIVLGGGNIVRGRDLSDVEREIADKMGMLATVINALFLQDGLEKRNIAVRTQTAIEMREIAEPLISRRASRHMEKGRIVILACGTGHSHCTTDYAAMLRAYELNAEALFKGTKVDGLFTGDPKNKDAKLIMEISYQEAQKSDFKDILDNAAFGLVNDNLRKIPLHIFNILKPKRNLVRLLLNEKIGTKIY
jgi:uridylate kinase